MDGSLFSLLIAIFHLTIVIVFAFVIMMQRRPVGVSLAWLMLLFALPVVGFVCYLLFGTKRLGHQRLKWVKIFYAHYQQWAHHLTKVMHEHATVSSDSDKIIHGGIYQLAARGLAIPALPNNRLQLYHTSDAIISHLITDIQQARQCLVLAFYIWEPAGRIIALTEAVIAAAKRGVDCLVVLDAVGSHRFFNSSWARRLTSSGATVTQFMPVGPVRMLVERLDIRNHHKILVVDDAIAWTGSFNLVDSHDFKRDAHVGQWVDAMVRVEGIAAHVLGAIAQWDQTLATGESNSSFNSACVLPASIACSTATTAVHVLPSGPDIDRALLYQILLTAVYESQEELLIATPYFVPDEALLTALKSAAMRGVSVILLIPERNDSRLVYYASRAYYQDLLAVGVQIHHFQEGLLHTKCVLVDRATVLFGTVSLDMRSVWLNFEVTLIVYDLAFGQTIATLMDDYLQRAKPINKQQWNERPWHCRFLENACQLLSPLL